MAGVQGARHCLLPRRLAGARPYVAGRHCGHPRHRLAVRADVLAGGLRGVHCALARYCTLKLVCPDLITKVIGFARQSGLAASELALLGLWPS
jgi:hypothetical protein